jgi:hypothetical protein
MYKLHLVGYELHLNHTSGRQQESMTIPKATYTQFYKLLVMDGKSPETCRTLIIIKEIV